MRKLATAIPLACLLVIGSLSHGRAETLSCVTVNGESVCSRSGQSLSCETVDGRTTCRHQPPPPPCRMGKECQTAVEQDEADDDREGDWTDTEDVEVRRDADGLHVRAGTFSLRIQ